MSIYKDGIMGLIVGDALGGPVQFMTRKEVAENPVAGMREVKPFRLPTGSWSDDGSMAIAILDSLQNHDEVDLTDIMDNFVKWYDKGEYTPLGFAFDEGGTTCKAIEHYMKYKDVGTCGQTHERSLGNGSLMRAIPICIFCSENESNGSYSTDMAMDINHRVSALTHAHKICKIGCGIYYMMAKSILNNKEALSLKECLQKGIDEAVAYYDEKEDFRKSFYPYVRMLDMDEFASLPEDSIKSGGYVVDTLEAAVWGLLNTDTFKDCLLKVVNLGDDSDTVGAVTGGLAGIYYGYDNIPKEWIDDIQRKEWILGMLEKEESYEA